MNTVFISEWDTNHFGFKVAKLNVASPKEILPALDICAKEEVVLLICRCNTNDNPSVHLLEQQGFLLMDTLVRYHLDLTKVNTTTDLDLSIIRCYENRDVESIVAIASEAFRDYISHFHKDPRLDPAKCDSLYVQWAYNSCHDKSVAEEVLVAEVEKKIVGFVGLELINSETGDFGVGAVSPEAQGKGIYRRLYLASIDWCKSKGLSLLQCKTQVNNYAVQKVWSDLGFRLSDSLYTLHKWLK